MLRNIIFIFTVGLLLAPLGAWAVPATLSHQGHILNSNYQPMTGVIDMTFAFYDSASGGSALWEESLSVAFDNGFYSVVLGDDSNNPILESHFDGADRYLGISVDDGAEMAPRFMITSVPYAMRSGMAEGVTGSVDAVDGISVDGNQVIDAQGQWVGADIDFGSLANVPDDLADGDDVGVVGSGTTNNLVKFSGDGELDDSVVVEDGGNIGIGTAPDTLLHVGGDAKVDGGLTIGDATDCGSENPGTLRWHSGQVEVCNGVSWAAIYRAPPEGGDVTTYTNNGDDYMVHTFTESSTLSVQNAMTVDLLIVGGGGSGGWGNTNEAGGGGGAGGLLYGTVTLDPGDYDVVVGDFSTAPSDTGLGAAGNPSSFGDWTASGGGAGGGCGSQVGGSGASGGGGNGCGSDHAGGSGNQDNVGPLTGYGNNGGAGAWVSNGPGVGNGGGGGGAGAVGGSGHARSADTAGGAGAGRHYDINGSNIEYARGGNGGRGRASINGVDGPENKGQGGQGGTVSGSQGGSGIVIVRYQSN